MENERNITIYFDEDMIAEDELCALHDADYTPIDYDNWRGYDNATLLVGADNYKRIIDNCKASNLFVFADVTSEVSYQESAENNIIQCPTAMLKDGMLKPLLGIALELNKNSNDYAVLLKELNEKKDEIIEINQMGIALGTIKDHATFHRYLLTNMRKILKSDGASLYIVDPDDKTKLIFTYVQSHSRDLPFESTRIPINTNSIAGYTAEMNTIVNIADAYDLDDSLPITFNTTYDKLANYRTKSILSIPMTNHTHELLGVIQLINKKVNAEIKLETPEFIEKHVLPFAKSDENLALSLANLAGISLENNHLYKSIENLFEGFIHASVSAIEQRDPTTSGHSKRVAVYSTALAIHQMKSSLSRTGVDLSDKQLKEVYYASLLHDFGKIGVREHVLIKAKKLYDPDLKLLDARFKFIIDYLEKQMLKEKIAVLSENGGLISDTRIKNIERRSSDEIAKIENIRRVIHEANEPTILPKESSETLNECRNMIYSFDGNEYPLLTEQEFNYLSVTKGSLNEEERLEIESHVTHTYNFLKKIPWTKELKDVADIAHGHHEKLDGSGYPQGLTAERIPVQTRIMTISDIFDALTAWDRPYKRAMQAERAIEILGFEVKGRKIDADLLQIFINARVFDLKDTYQNHDFESLMSILR